MTMVVPMRLKLLVVAPAYHGPTGDAAGRNAGVGRGFVLQLSTAPVRAQC
eukprot:CAMPEP_0171683210 /NCGR_PEP_ID=MMETSP0991-20121206/979_1 /TAXON_ID=483369 /ORGANISM="non described non described, Strain CCMP2098" /LENGTH=49 /DNA_ID=CAMNT_0012270547 /DNA_START=1245 /DNA_END=1394 /DNA_ORIENTATION=+